MTVESAWRPMPPEVTDLISAIVVASGVPGADALVDGLDGAVVTNETAWILDVRPSRTATASDLPDGPFPVRAYVPNNAEYQGELIIWLSKGHVSGFEYAWIGDQTPARWPGPSEIDIVARSSS